MAFPVRCLVAEPHSHSVDFAGVHINLKMLATAAGLHHTYVSRVFSGVRPLPRIETARKMADALGMPFDDFIAALEVRASRELQKRIEARKPRRLFKRRRDLDAARITL